jgi:hypothetical protein
MVFWAMAIYGWQMKTTVITETYCLYLIYSEAEGIRLVPNHQTTHHHFPEKSNRHMV